MKERMHVPKISAAVVLSLLLGSNDRCEAAASSAEDSLHDDAYAFDYNNARSLQDLETICNLSGGTITEEGDCSVCLDEVNCCTLDPTTFGLACYNFCTTTVYSSLEQTYCGAATCVVQGTTSLCTGTIPFSSIGDLVFVFDCAAGAICTCSEVSFGGEKCNGCTGPLSGYDCSNVENGPIKEAPSEDGGSQNKPADIDRPYRTDAEFLAAVDKRTMAEASKAAGVPIGFAAPGEGYQPYYEKYIPTDYNMVVPENELKWNKLLKNEVDLSSYDFTLADDMVDSAIKAGAEIVRGHVLIWGRVPGTTYPLVLQEIEKQLADNTVYMRQTVLKKFMNDHIDTVANHFKGRVAVWDVVNEHLSSRNDDNIFYTTFGDDYVKLSFLRAAEILNDDTALVWNEAIANFSPTDPSIVLWLELLEQYKSEGIPIDTVGIQGHNIFSTHNMEDVKAFMNKVAELGYDIEITELDAKLSLFSTSKDYVSEDAFERQGRFLTKYARACIDSGHCKGITFWGPDDSHTWMDSVFPNEAPNLPLLIDEEGYKKPAWLYVREALFNESANNGGTSSAFAIHSTLNVCLGCLIIPLLAALS